MKSVGWALIQYDWCLYIMRRAASGTSGAEWERWVWGYGEKEG